MAKGEATTRQRVLILTPGGSDAAQVARVLVQAGLETEICPAITSLCHAIEAGAGTVLVATEALSPENRERLDRTLAKQPDWSLLPVVVLNGGGRRRPSQPRIGHLLGTLKGAILLERPVQQATLISLLKSTLYNRRRQYQVRDLLVALEDSQTRLHRQAYYDVLTGLPNRALLNDRMEHALAHAKRSGHGIAVLFLDLDRFKLINDSLGHGVGDGLLHAVAERLSSHLRDHDTVARLGGDEFVVLLEDLPQTAQVDPIARKLLEAMRQAFSVDGHHLFINTSIGISLFPKDGEHASVLLKRADTALYQAKAQGRNNLQFYAAAVTTHAEKALALEQDLRLALERDELELYYQPRVNLISGRITALEALLRWRHPVFGAVSPTLLVRLAEESGLIGPLSDWVLQTTCTQIRTWRDQALSPVPVAINLSARQFTQAGLVERIGKAFQRTALEAQCLELEITENILMSDTAYTLTTLRALREWGVRIAIDDFGTGYSSLSYLKRLPVDWLKIDQSFIKDILINPDDALITTAIIQLAHNLHLKTVAEGVESKPQQILLKAKQCDEMQGYYFSHPVPALEVPNLLSQALSIPMFSHKET